MEADLEKRKEEYGRDKAVLAKAQFFFVWFSDFFGDNAHKSRFAKGCPFFGCSREGDNSM